MKMMWFCGGHGTCLTGTGPDGHFEKAVIAWLRALRQARQEGQDRPRLRVAGRRRQVAQLAALAAAAGHADLRGRQRHARRSARPTRPRATRLAAAPATNAVNVPVPLPTAQVVGKPRLKLTYSGTGAVTHVFAQIVDEQRNVVVGNLVTPLPVTLDGATHTVSRPLEAIAASLTPTGRYRLQVIGGSQVYGPVRGAAAITFSAIDLDAPDGRPGQGVPDEAAASPSGCRAAWSRPRCGSPASA